LQTFGFLFYLKAGSKGPEILGTVFRCCVLYSVFALGESLTNGKSMWKLVESAGPQVDACARNMARAGSKAGRHQQLQFQQTRT